MGPNGDDQRIFYNFTSDTQLDRADGYRKCTAKRRTPANYMNFETHLTYITQHLSVQGLGIVKKSVSFIVVIFVSIVLGGNAGQGAAAGVSSSGATIGEGTGNGGQSVDPNPFCNTGVITPLCNGGTKILGHSNEISGHSNPVSDMCVKYNNDTNTISVSCNTNLSEIDHTIKNRNVLEKDPLRVWVLKATINVDPKAKLTINRTDTSWLKITNKNNTAPNFISVSGGLKIDGIKITSWDPSTSNVIRQNVNGSIPRPYIRIHNASGSANISTNISNSEVAFLGYESVGGTNGLLFYYGGKGSSILNNTFHDMWDGFYSDGVSLITIKNNKYYNNLRYGVDPHSGSHDLTIIGNLVYNNNHIGIICSDHCDNLLFSSNVVHNNGMAGLMFSLDTNNSIAKNNYAYNEKIGISLYQSSNDKVYNNLVKSSNKALYITGSSSDNQIYNNTLMNDPIGIYIHLDSNSENNLFNNNHFNNVSQPISKINPPETITEADTP